MNDPWDQMSSSGLGVSMEGVYCGAPMYADDLALIASSEQDHRGFICLHVALQAECSEVIHISSW